MHFLKEGQKIRAWVDPPLIWARPKRKRFFLLRPSLSYDDRHLAHFGNRDHHLEFCGEEVDFFPQEKKFLLAVERGDVASTRRLVSSFGLISDLFAI